MNVYIHTHILQHMVVLLRDYTARWFSPVCMLPGFCGGRGFADSSTVLAGKGGQKSSGLLFQLHKLPDLPFMKRKMRSKAVLIYTQYKDCHPVPFEGNGSLSK